MRKIFIAIAVASLLVLLVTGVAWWRDVSKPHWVSLTWSPVPPGADFRVVGYNVYRTKEPKGQYVRIATRVPEARYEDRLVKARRTYFYVVTAVDEKGRESPYSGQIKVKVP